MSCPACNLKLIPIYHDTVDMKAIEQVIRKEIHIGYRYSLENYFCTNCHLALRDNEVIE